MRSGHRLGAAVLVVGLFAGASAGAAEIPAWLDEAISGWNERNPGLRIEFVDIKDSFVWYRIQDTPELGQAEIRDLTDKLIQEKGYASADSEEKVTTARVPSPSVPGSTKKCWRRSFVLTLTGATSNTTDVSGEHAGVSQRLLTRMLCEDGPSWDAGFRIVD